MKVLFHLGHPAHFHLFKNVISKLQDQNHEIHILIKDKDVLRNLLDGTDLPYHNILKEGKSSGKAGMLKDLVKRGSRMIRYCREVQPDVLVGTSVDIPYTGKILGIPSVNVNEDDAAAVPLYAWMAYPLSTKIISPDSCDNGRWHKKTTHYPGYHELAYLHPDHFEPDQKTVSKYISAGEEYVVLRFAGLNAHHDEGVRGINNETARQLVKELLKFKKVVITSERELLQELEPYRISIQSADMHDILAHASFIVGDSQTMSAEAAVLGTPYIRYNDFVGKIGYLKELEEKYQLGYGIKPDNEAELLQTAQKLASCADIKKKYRDKRVKMLSEKINTAEFLYEEIINTVAHGN
jgi:predicted glycosyltransferase